MEFKKIPLENIKRRYLHVKKELVDDSMSDLVLSIKTLGLIQPIIVCKNSEKKYDVIDGNRRLKTCTLLNEKYPGQGFDEIECVIHEKNDQQTAIRTSTKLTTTPVDSSDLFYSMDLLWNSLLDLDLIQKRYGISEKIAKRYLHHQWWPESLKSAIYSGEISSHEHVTINCISDAILCLNWPYNSNVSEEKIILLAKKLAMVSNTTHDEVQF